MLNQKKEFEDSNQKLSLNAGNASKVKYVQLRWTFGDEMAAVKVSPNFLKKMLGNSLKSSSS